MYGVSTGFGSLARVRIPAERRAELQKALVRSHASGMGAPIEREVVRAMMVLRARTLAMGWSGTRPVVAQTIAELLNAGITPVVPEYGSLGASGDLAPLAHCALALIGEGEVDVGVGVERRRRPQSRPRRRRRAGDAHARGRRARRRADHAARAERQGGPGADQRHRRDARHARARLRRSEPPAPRRGHHCGDVGRGAARDRPGVRAGPRRAPPPARSGGKRREPVRSARRIGDRGQPSSRRPARPGRLLAALRSPGQRRRPGHAHARPDDRRARVAGRDRQPDGAARRPRRVMRQLPRGPRRVRLRLPRRRDRRGRLDRRAADGPAAGRVALPRACPRSSPRTRASIPG